MLIRRKDESGLTADIGARRVATADLLIDLPIDVIEQFRGEGMPSPCAPAITSSAVR